MSGPMPPPFLSRTLSKSQLSSPIFHKIRGSLMSPIPLLPSGITRHSSYRSSLIYRRELLSACHGAVHTPRRHRCSYLVTSRRSILPPPLLFGSWAANSSLLFVLVVAVTSVQPPPMLSPSVSPSFLSTVVLLLLHRDKPLTAPGCCSPAAVTMQLASSPSAAAAAPQLGVWRLRCCCCLHVQLAATENHRCCLSVDHSVAVVGVQQTRLFEPTQRRYAVAGSKCSVAVVAASLESRRAEGIGVARNL